MRRREICSGGGCRIHIRFSNLIFRTYKYDLHNSQFQVLYEMKRQGHAGVAGAWREAGLTWAEFLPEATEVTYHAF